MSRRPAAAVLFRTMAVAAAVFGPIVEDAVAGDQFDLRHDAVADAVRDGGVHPWQDDATLHDIQFVGRQTGWAVGDHGIVWKTGDGGDSWQRIDLPFDVSLRSVCFLTQEADGNRVATSQVAWIAGRTTQPYSRAGQGLLLKTVDGGGSWQVLAADQNLPALNYVRFFGAEDGVAVGEATAEFPTGVLITGDGGESWTAAPGPSVPGWLTAAFTGINDGTVGGPQGRLALVAGGSVAPPRQDLKSLRSVRGVAMVDGLAGWAVGDGALLLRTGNGGVSWEPVTGFDSFRLSRFVDLRAVAAQGDSAWVAGSPGSCVWRTDDAGATWERALTGQTVPLRALHFTSERHGWGVGDLGVMIRTQDGGRTWTTVRTGRRRAAVLAIHTRPERIAFGMMARYAGDEGFRTVALLVPRRVTAESAMIVERRIHDAVTGVGANAACTGWRLPISLPELESSLDALTAEWQKHTEGRLVEVVISNLTGVIRTWRPDIVVIEQPEENDSAAVLIRDAVVRAVAEAADPTRQIEQQEEAGLEHWRVQRVFLRAQPDVQASVVIDPFDSLPRLGTTVEAAAMSGRARVLNTVEPLVAEPFVPLDDSADRFTLVSRRELWTGLSVAPGSEARRVSLPLDEEQLERQQEAARKQRHFRGIAASMMRRPAQAAQLVAELRTACRELPRAQAALQVAGLARDYRRTGQWDLAEATMIELIDQYPDQPVAAEGMLWLLHLWSSDEMAWQRSRGVSLTAAQYRSSRSAITGRMEQLLKAANRPADDPVRLARQLNAHVFDEAEIDRTLSAQNADDWQAATVSFWQRQAVQMARVIQRRLPEAFLVPEVRWPVASVLRRQGHLATADSLYRRYVSPGVDDAAGRIPRGEVWLAQPVDQMPSHLHSCSMATVRPYLDGVLGDGCWQEARPMRLSNSSPGEEFTAEESAAGAAEQPLAFLSYDQQFLYFAASLPRPEGTAAVRPQLAGRRHDADHTGFDRISLWLDIDRDYVTGYRITVDQRGHVSESCWEDDGWNPRLHVAVVADENRWRVEMAIPLAELTARGARHGDVWAVRIARTVPQRGWQSWIPPFRGEENPESFGLVQFR